MALRCGLLRGGERLGVWAATWPSWPILLRRGLETKIEYLSALHSADGGAQRDAGKVALTACGTWLGIGEKQSWV
jgi:hypothetical protein